MPRVTLGTGRYRILWYYLLNSAVTRIETANIIFFEACKMWETRTQDLFFFIFWGSLLSSYFSRIMLFQIVLYFGIIAIIAYFIYPLHNNIEEYFRNKVVWITGKWSSIGIVKMRWENLSRCIVRNWSWISKRTSSSITHNASGSIIETWTRIRIFSQRNQSWFQSLSCLTVGSRRQSIWFSIESWSCSRSFPTYRCFI